MVLTHNLTDTVGRFLVSAVRRIAHFVHSEEHTAVYRLQTVSDIREGSRHYNRHRVVDVGALHLVFNIDFNDAVCFNHSFYNAEADIPRR